jgi:hypothetical protein
MANTLNLYDPLFYAQEALRVLTKSLGMAGSVYRGYEPTPTQKGSTIKINRPSTFVATNMPSTATDLAPNNVDLVVNNWKGVVFQLTDKELAFTKEKIIEDHISPAAYAVADAIDQTLVALYKDVPTAVATDGTTPANDFPNLIAQLFGQKVPKTERAFMMSGAQEALYLKQSLFVQSNTSSNGAESQRNGYIGDRFGFSNFSNQNVFTHVPGTLVPATAMVVTGAQAIGVRTFNMGGGATLTGTVKQGDIFTIAGGTEGYAVAADATAAGNSITITIADERGLRRAMAGGEVATFVQTSKVENLVFHKNAFALGMAPLSEIGGMLGAKIATVADPVTGLALRSRMWYDGDNARVKVGIDALWGVKTLDSELATRLRA